MTTTAKKKTMKAMVRGTVYKATVIEDQDGRFLLSVTGRRGILGEKDRAIVEAVRSALGCRPC